MKAIDSSASDTIAAIATPPGEGGIAVVRISGTDSLEIADRILRSKSVSISESAGNAMIHAFFVCDDKPLDEVLVLIMRAPRSYTKEDVVEIQCHGGVCVSRLILRAALSKGARMAAPGEFTLRAFLNGRIDLVQAEAVADLISAESERAAMVAMDQLKGGLSRQFTTVYQNIVDLAGKIEASLDFADEDVPPIPINELAEGVDRAISASEDMLASYEEGQLLRSGVRVVISGKPNVGKSTLLNLLLQSNRAIVSHLPGTTRDTIEEKMLIDGFPIVLTDTAGLRATECEIEEAGIRRAIEKISSADINIYIIDSQKQIDEEDLRFLREHSPERTILVRNKIDLGPIKTRQIEDLEAIDSSLLDGKGLEAIKAALRMTIEKNICWNDSPHSAISERHFHLLTEAHRELLETQRLLNEATPGCEVLAASRLRFAADGIGEILGRNYNEEILDNIFSNFCLGK